MQRLYAFLKSSVWFSVSTPLLEQRWSCSAQSRLKMVFCCSMTQRSLSLEERSITWWRSGSYKGWGSIFSWKKKSMSEVTAALSLVYSRIIILICVVKSDFPFAIPPCRVWPNTAGVTLEQKVDHLPFCHLVRWGENVIYHHYKHCTRVKTEQIIRKIKIISQKYEVVKMRKTGCCQVIIIIITAP